MPVAPLGGSRGAIYGAPKPAAFDLGGWGVGELLTAYNNPGTLVGAHGATAGTPGHLVSNAGARAASRNSYNLANADQQKVYGEAMRLVRGQAPITQAGYDANTATMQADARSRAIANQQMLATDSAQAAAGAQNLGLAGVGGAQAPSAVSRTSQILAQASARGQANADARTNFNAEGGKIAGNRIERNALQFNDMSTKQQQKLSESLAKMIAKKGDYMTGGTRGRKASAGKLVGALTNPQRLGVAKSLLAYSGSDFRNDLAAARYVDSKKP